MKAKYSYAFVNCNIINGIPDSEVLKDAVLLVNNSGEKGLEFGKIEKIGRKGFVNIPDNYKTIDLGGKYIMPGLINAHIHLFGSGKPMKAFSNEWSRRILVKLIKTPLAKSVLLKAMRNNVLAELNSGVTTVRCLGDFLHFDVKLRKDVENGKLIGPRIIACGRGISVTGGHGAPDFAVISDSPWEARKCVRMNLEHEVDVIKAYNTGGVLDARRIGDAALRKMTPEEIAAVCDEAHRAGLMVASHSESMEGVREALLAGVDTIEHGAEMDDEIVRLFKENPKSLRGYSALVPTLYPAVLLTELDTSHTKINKINKDNAVLVRDGMISGLKRAMTEGIKIGFGTDASVPFVTQYDTWRELECRVKWAGIKPIEAIYQATASNAEVLGIESETGTIEAEKSADFIVVEGNPAQNLRVLASPSMVVTGGWVIENPRVKKIKYIESLIEGI